MGAQDIAKLKPQFDELGVRLVCIGYEDVGAQEFLDGKYWEGELLIDQPQAVFKALNTKSAGLHTLAFPSVINGLRRASGLGISANQEGNNLTDGRLGGTYVVHNGELVYQYQHQSFSDHVAGAEVVKACKAAAKGEGEMPKSNVDNEGGGCCVM